VIAREAGVSQATVSKVINGRNDVSAATRLRVEELLATHRYTPVGQRGGTTMGLVEVVFNGLDSPWAIEILRGTTSTLTEGGAHSILSTMPPPEDPRWPHTVLLPGRSGVIVVSSTLTERHRQEITEEDVPLVVVDPADIPSPHVVSVGATNWAGGLAATEHLIGLGHRRIAAIGGTPTLLCSRARIDGYRAAHDHHGIPADPNLVRHGDFHHEGGFVAALELLGLEDPPTAFFAGSDQQAFGVIQAARVRGLRVPDDVSVVGFDDLPVARWASPPLTTVVQPLAEMGRTAARMLLRMIAGQPLGSRRVELATQRVVRESTAPPRERRGAA
jgi:LacI family transcriptional regulator